MTTQPLDSDDLKQRIQTINTPWCLEARKIVSRAFHIARSPAELCVAFNGGKDCTALLYLVLAEWLQKFPGTPMPVLYIVDKPEEVFPEIDAFVRETVSELPIELIEISRLPTPAALAELLRMRPEIRSVFMGTRKTDPHGNQLEAFTPTDVNWPPVIRVNPVLNWRYRDVWNFLRLLNVPVCTLYAAGYTSIGDKSTTFPNPRLVEGDGKSPRHAAELEDSDQERAGRVSKK